LKVVLGPRAPGDAPDVDGRASFPTCRARTSEPSKWPKPSRRCWMRTKASPPNGSSPP
jgi:hypothetical protein